MESFNLLRQPWIRVMKNLKGETEELSIIDVFKHADSIIDLSGDTPTQDFAVLRVLLAILHTVYSRYNYEGETHVDIEVDDMMRQIEEVDEDNATDTYQEELEDTWKELWTTKEFSDILYQYLETWEDRFNLFDEEYPFFQATLEDIDPNKLIKSRKAGKIWGKTMNRLVSESGNKIALFSPKSHKQKDKLTEAEIARWLITFHGYPGLSDKSVYDREEYTKAKGWLFDLGGIYLKGNNLYETFLLNLVMIHSREEYAGKVQKPSWEFESSEWIERHFKVSHPDNIAELYTRWSRAIYMDSEVDISKPFSFQVVKIPEIDHVQTYIEPMTVWRYNKSGDNKDMYTPRKHPPQQSMWRSFGLITMPDSLTTEGERNIKPEVLNWLGKVKDIIGDYDLRIQSVSMRDDGNATSWMPIDEIVDTLRINDTVLVDEDKEGWIVRITETIDFTKETIERTYRIFLNDIRQIRNLDTSHQFIAQNIEAMYYQVDQPFRDWLASIRPEHTKAEKVSEWKNTLRELVLIESEKHLEDAGTRDYLGTVIEEKNVNIITAHNKFKHFLNKE
ncbi:type I-E CRISPR-associated protein Cse1/CasA [Aerococcaceae bacterium WGS1372]